MSLPLLVSSGEPAGIGPDICLALAKWDLPLVVLADKLMLAERAERLGLSVELLDYNFESSHDFGANRLYVYPITGAASVCPGVLNPANSAYVIQQLTLAAQLCEQKQFSALITAPVHKAVINAAGFPFTGHTEFLADYFQVNQVVMMLACDAMKVALATTHLPLQSVSAMITRPRLLSLITQLHDSLQQDFGYPDPCILVAGLNPHAGEGGYLGREEIDVITPAIQYLQQQGMAIQGPFPADTLFTPHNLKKAHAFVAMYHDQGLPVLKYAGFGQAVNISLGLPIIRTSVDHGTALELAGTGKADAGSLRAAIKTAQFMVSKRAAS